MNALRFGLVALLVPAAPAAPQAPAATPAVPAPPAPIYRGFAPGAAYRQFSARARELAWQEPLICNTSRRTAQLMECGVVIRDPTDGVKFYLSAYVLEGKVAMVSFGDSGTSALVDRMKRDLSGRFGKPRVTGIGTWEWKFGRQVARLNWRGRGSVRWVYLVLEDRDILDRISRYVTVRRKP